MESIFLNDKNITHKYIAFFDLDRTLIKTNSGKTIVLQAYKHKLLTRPDLIRGIYLSLLFKLDLRETTKIIDSMVSWIKGISENKMNELTEEIFKNRILQSIYDEVKSEINFHKSKGGKVVILSSAILPICKMVADYLSIDDIICSNLEIVNGMYTGRPLGRICFGEEKQVRLIEFCKINHIDPRDSWYYGDSIADFPALSSVGFPVCINPDRKLKRTALKRGWKILTWH